MASITSDDSEKALSTINALNSDTFSSSHSRGDGQIIELSASSSILPVSIIVASVIALVVILFVICYRQRDESKVFSPSESSISVFQGVTTTTASKCTLNNVTASTPSTVVASPRPPFMHTLKLPGLSVEESSVDHVALDIDESQEQELFHVPRNTNEFNAHTASISIYSRLRSSLPSLAIFKLSSASQANDIIRSTMYTHALTTPSAHSVPTTPYAKGVDSLPSHDMSRNRSETCWSIDPGSDSETEYGRFFQPTASRLKALGAAIMFSENRLSALLDTTADSEEVTSKDALVSSLDQVSCQEYLLSYFFDCGELSLSQLDDLSPQRVHAICAVGVPRTSNSVAEIETNKSVCSNFSTSLDYYGESFLYNDPDFFDDIASESRSSTTVSCRKDDAAYLREEEF